MFQPDERLPNSSAGKFYCVLKSVCWHLPKHCCLIGKTSCPKQAPGSAQWDDSAAAAAGDALIPEHRGTLCLFPLDGTGLLWNGSGREGQLLSSISHFPRGFAVSYTGSHTSHCQELVTGAGSLSTEGEEAAMPLCIPGWVPLHPLLPSASTGASC